MYPTEIFPTFLRAKGNAFGVAGWAIGYGGGSLLVPVMFAGIDEKVSQKRHFLELRPADNILARPSTYLERK